MSRIRQMFLLVIVFAVLLGYLPPVQAQAAGPLPLSAYPRPPQDNGRGIHWAPTLFGQHTEMVDRLVAETVAMDMKWVKIMQGDVAKIEHDYLVKSLTAKGIMPVLRIFKSRNEPYQHLSEIVSIGVPMGVYYYELYNEPNLSGDPGGWNTGEAISVEKIVDLWIPAAASVVAAGGYPSLPSLSPGGNYEDTLFLRDFLRTLKARGRTDLLYRAWMPLHNYVLNHPINYPYDDVNLKSVPLTQAEISASGMTDDEVTAINHARSISHLPRSQGGYYVGDTIYEDSNCFMKFQAYARIFEDEVGFIIPIISTEGGAIIGSHEDPRYPPVTAPTLVSITQAAFDYMAKEAPDYYFAFMPWLLANRAGGSLEGAWENAAWLKEDGSALPVVAALKASKPANSLKAAATAISTATASQKMAASSATATVQSTSAPNEQNGFQMQMPDISSVSRRSSPAEPNYPREILNNNANPPTKALNTRVIVLSNSNAEVWLAPELGARIVRLVDKTSNTEVIPLVQSLSLQPLDKGAYYMRGGSVWLYPSPAFPQVDNLSWEVAADSQANPVTLICHDPRSHTDLRLTVSLADNGSITLQMLALNNNKEQRSVGLSLAQNGTGPFALLGDSQVVIAAGGSYEWHSTWKPSGAITATPTPAATSKPLPTPLPTNGASLPTPIVPTVAPVSTPKAPNVPSNTNVKLNWDTRLDQLGITLSTGAGHWRLVEAKFQDETQSGGQHNIFVRLLDSNGKAIAATSSNMPWVAWSDGKTNIETKPVANNDYLADFPMYGPLSSYRVGVGANSDVVSGLGLPGKQHVNFILVFQEQS